jgi:hypothetical protein
VGELSRGDLRGKPRQSHQADNLQLTGSTPVRHNHGHPAEVRVWVAVVRPGPGPALQPWVLIGAGAATVVEAKLDSWQSFLALLGYCVLASSTYLAMEIYAVARPRNCWPGSGPGSTHTPTR